MAYPSDWLVSAFIYKDFKGISSSSDDQKM